MKHNTYMLALCAFILLGLYACAKKEVVADISIDNYPPIYPDFAEVTVAPNFVSPRFWVQDSCDEAQAVFNAGAIKYIINSKARMLSLTEAEWDALLDEDYTVNVNVYTRKGDKWTAYKPFNIYVVPDSIDKFIAYRLIEPGYESWSEMGIYQRCLEGYRQDAVITNRQTDYGCMNCHSFCNQDPNHMMLHLRRNHGGTYFIEDGEVTKLNTKTDETISPLVYPSWHPSGRYVAFSVNDTKQMFHTSDPNRIEVYDNASDVVVYDIENHEIVTSPILMSKTQFATFPTFSPDGKTLYFCCADSVDMPGGYDRLQYSLYSVGFDPEKRTFGTDVDTLYNAQVEGGSVALPRVSPDGRLLMFTLSDYGTFPIWHRDADLYMIDLATGEVAPVDAFNSGEADSYHSWSSNSRWVVFSSRRDDGLYTRPYIGYIDANGKAYKPIMMPPISEGYYDRLMKSYNIPEFIKDPITVTGYDISQKAKTDPGIDVTMAK